MKPKFEQFPAKNPNPVISVGKDGTILYSNAAGELLLLEWSVGVGEKLPSYIGNFVQKVVSQNSPEKMEVKVGNRVYLIVFHPLPEEKCVSISGFDINDQKNLEENIRESEAWEKANLELDEVIDTHAIQSLMDNFYKLVHIPIGLNDLKGNVLVGVGWQDICTKFHRVNPEACKHCVESDIKLTTGFLPGEFKLYKCKNNMWDMATPIIVGGQHVGYVFSGQFFFEDETLDYELFRSQARQYGFDEERYIAALEKVPRLSKGDVNTGMSFLMTFANMVSQLSYNNIKLVKSLAERDSLVKALQEIEKRERARSEELAVVLDAVPAAVWITHDPYALYLTGNRLSYEWLRLPEGANASKATPEGERPETYKMFKDGIEIPVADMPVRMSAAGIKVHNYEFDLFYPDGAVRHLLGNARPLSDEQGNPRGAVSAFIDITERKKAEEALRVSNFYNRSLIEASLDPLVTIGHDGKITDVNGATEQVTGYSRNDLIGTDFSDYFNERAKAHEGYHQVFTDGEVRDYPLEIRHKNGHITPVLYNASVYKDENGEVIGVFAAARDITKRKKAEEALKKAHEDLEKIVEERTTQLEKAYKSLRKSEKGLADAQKMARIGNWEWDTTTDKAYWSEEMYRIFGRNPQELAPSFNEYLSYIHPDDRDYYCNALKKAVNGSPFGIDYRIVLVNGEERTVHLESESICNDVDIPIRVKGIVQDITERRKAEEKIQNLANIVESSNDAIGTLSLSGIITSWNTGAEQIYGYSAEEILGKSISILAPSHLDKETKKLIKKIKQREKIQRFRTFRLKKDGTIINVSITLSPVLDIHGQLTAVSFISRDITETKRAEEKLRESEEKYRNIVETANEGILIIDYETIVNYANKRMVDMLGYTLEEVIGRSICEFLSKKSKAIILNMEKRWQGMNESYELKLIRKDGSSLWALINTKPLFDKNGKFVGAMSMFTDITERKETEQEILQAKFTAESANRAKSEFLTNMSHELRTPLTSIIGFSDLMLAGMSGELSEKNRKYINNISISGKHLLSLINNILDLSKIEASRMELELEMCSVPDIFNDIRDVISALAMKKFISLDFDVEGELFVSADMISFKQIIYNLVSNAIKFTPKGGSVKVLAKREGDVSRISVSDTGIGISKENQNLLFHPFKQIDSGINRQYEGTGLGLALARKFVELHGGRIWVESKPGKGSTFTFELPLKHKATSEIQV